MLLEGSPVSPPDRFAAVIARHRVSVLKAGSTFLRVCMAMPDAAARLGAVDMACAPPPREPETLRVPSLAAFSARCRR